MVALFIVYLSISSIFDTGVLQERVTQTSENPSMELVTSMACDDTIPDDVREYYQSIRRAMAAGNFGSIKRLMQKIQIAVARHAVRAEQSAWVYSLLAVMLGTMAGLIFASGKAVKYKTFGEELRALRLLLEWSQEKVGKQVGLPQGSISRIERNEMKPIPALRQWVKDKRKALGQV
jgi:DNA-binding XRE family transcriptional regulator